jgi:hypothetical protein
VLSLGVSVGTELVAELGIVLFISMLEAGSIIRVSLVDESYQNHIPAITTKVTTPIAKALMTLLRL